MKVIRKIWGAILECVSDVFFGVILSLSFGLCTAAAIWIGHAALFENHLSFDQFNELIRWTWAAWFVFLAIIWLLKKLRLSIHVTIHQ